MEKNRNVKYRAYEFALGIIKFIDTLPDRKAYWSLGDQLLRAATSVGANLVEATGSASKRDFLKFYYIALKSANESKFWLALIRDSGKGDSRLAQELLEEAKQLAKMIAASILTIKGKRSKKILDLTSDFSF
jgi:four helix bundle protein